MYCITDPVLGPRELAGNLPEQLLHIHLPGVLAGVATPRSRRVRAASRRSARSDTVAVHEHVADRVARAEGCAVGLLAAQAAGVRSGAIAGPQGWGESGSP